MENEDINTPVAENTPVSVKEITVPAPTPIPAEPSALPAEPPAVESVTQAPEVQPQATAPVEPVVKTEIEQPKIPPTPPSEADKFIKGGVITDLLQKAKEKIQLRKRAKLEKIMAFAQSKGKVTNNDAQKLLRCSDATATRYLFELVKQGRLKMISRRGGAFYQLP